jgi:acetyl esterase/lipase
MEGIAVDLTRRGWTTWNVEYRRLGGGGGWPQTGQDVLAALRFVPSVALPKVGARADDVVIIGHSAGGQLALWAAIHWWHPIHRVIGLATVTDMEDAVARGLGGDAPARFLGSTSPTEASPIHQLPLGIPVTLVHGTNDPLVPVDHSRRYATAATAAGDEITYLEWEDATHMSLIDPHGDWPRVVRATGLSGH